MAERQFGPYKLVRQIAVGGMAEIHLAKTAGIAGFEKYVALKMIHPNFADDEQFIQMLIDEAKIAVQLTHGNIAQTFDLGRVGETYYITMEYVDGADLYKILRRASEQDLEMPLDVCAFIGKEILSALDHAHRKRDHTGRSLGIVHRDVSPTRPRSNVCAMLPWLSCTAIFASSTSIWMNCSSSAKFGWIILIATYFSNPAIPFVFARWISAIPPTATWRTNRYGPN